MLTLMLPMTSSCCGDAYRSPCRVLPHVVMEARIAYKQQVRGFVNPGTPLLSNPSLLPVHILEPVVRDGDIVRPQFVGYLGLCAASAGVF